MQPIHILKPGSFTDSTGQKVSFTEDDLIALAKAYDPALHEAPIVIGHPAADAPAYGWVGALNAGKGGVHASVTQIDAQLAELVSAGRYKKISAALYGPGHPNSPVKDTWYLRHVGFLGAQPPAVKGLKSAALGEDEQGVVMIEVDLAESNPWIFRSIAGIFRNLREHLIATTDKETADQAIPGFYIDDIAAASYNPQETTALAEINHPSEDNALSNTNTTTALAEQAKALAEQENALKVREAELAEAETQVRRACIQAQISTHEKAGRTLPADSLLLVALSETLAAQAVEIELSDADGKKSKQSLGAWFEEWLARLPVQVDYNEHSADKSTPKPASLKVPQGYSVAADQADLHAKVLILAEQKSISYEQALSQLSNT